METLFRVDPHTKKRWVVRGCGVFYFSFTCNKTPCQSLGSGSMPVSRRLWSKKGVWQAVALHEQLKKNHSEVIACTARCFTSGPIVKFRNSPKKLYCGCQKGGDRVSCSVSVRGVNRLLQYPRYFSLLRKEEVHTQDKRRDSANMKPYCVSQGHSLIVVRM